jgi:hypothetical protein
MKLWSYKNHMLALVLAFSGALCGCAREVVYTHVQNVDGLAMKAPITFTVRIQLDAERKVVTWMEDLEDSRGETDRRIRTYGGFASSVCEVFDEDNWNCEIRGVDGSAVERPEMKDGDLSRYYWGATEKYQKRRRFPNSTS